MHDARRLRDHILFLIAASGALGALQLAACGGKVAVDAGGHVSIGGGGSGGVGTTTGTGGVGAAPPVCDFGDATQQCQLPPAGGVAPDDCPPASEVEDGCCNTPTAGPFAQSGQCCYWFCEGACCGRAFTVEGRARVAGVVEREGWSRASPAAVAADLDEGTRAALVDAWLADAQMEHASVASFARFTLELLSLGAPAHLVEASQRASLDEVEHARLCFAIASRLGGRSYGPAALDLAGALREGSLAERAAAAVHEGCIGETVAALTARAQLDRAEDEDVRRALARIAADEEAHAALAWRFVAWAVEAGGDEVRAAVASAFTAGACRLRAQHTQRAGQVDEAGWRRFGRLTAADADRVARTALREVIGPCVEAMGRPSAPPREEDVPIG